MRRVAVLALVLLCGCSQTRTEHLDTLFETTRGELRAGELAKAQLAAEHGISVADSRHDPFFHWKFRLLRAEILLNSRRAEEVVAQLDEPVPPGSQFAPLAARKLMLEGQAASILGHADRSAALLVEAHRAAEAAKADEVLLDIENIQGARALRSERYDDAERFLRSALQRARALQAPYPEASVLVNLGMIRFNRHRYDEAAGFFEEASRRAGPQLQVLYSVAQSNLATCYSQLGDYDRAIRDLCEERGANTNAPAPRFYLQISLGETGHAYLLKGELKSAIPYLQRALSVASEIDSTADAAITGPAISRPSIANSAIGRMPRALTRKRSV